MNYWIITDDNTQGPYTLEQLSEIDLTADTPVWCEGMADWEPASHVDELAPYIKYETPAIPQSYLPPVPESAVVDTLPEIPSPDEVNEIVAGDSVVEQPATVVYAPAGVIPPGYVAIAPATEPKAPPSYLAWAIVSTIVFFMPLGICAIICAVKTGGHFKAGRYEKAARMSERAALFIILSLVVWLVWVPFSVVFTML